MRYFQLLVHDNFHLAVQLGDGDLTDLTVANPKVSTFLDLVQMAENSGIDPDSVTTAALEGKHSPTYKMMEVERVTREFGDGPRLVRPIVPPEVWAAGVTYERSLSERRRESRSPDIYSRVYESDRPEIFLKATSNRVVGPFDMTGIRGDSTWNVPEPELAFVLFKGKIVGYTIGNDVSSRSIEGENPLYLPQAKMYDRCCAIGPCIVSAFGIGDPNNLEISMVIMRDDQEIFTGTTSTARMVRSCEDIAHWLQLHNPVPDGTVVLTGTGLVPAGGFTLKQGDICRITIENIGMLEVGTITV
jgi:2-dehydro-3-deoxy-D-arabinonate dehydratase